jgi:hypothetical protein
MPSRHVWTAKGHHAKKDPHETVGRRKRRERPTTSEHHALRLRPGSDVRRRPAAGVRNRRKDLQK